MTYTKTPWVDNVVEYPNRYVQTAGAAGTIVLTKSEGNVVQAGTPLSASNLNKIEQGVADAHAQMDQAARQTQTLIHGLSVLNGAVDAPVDIQIEGRTLTSMLNSDLDATKYYVLADKKTKLTYGSTEYTGVAKFTGVVGKPAVIKRIANFENKVSASTLENPHLGKYKSGPALDVPSAFVNEMAGSTPYGNLVSLNGALSYFNNGAGNTQYAQQLFSFDIIQEIERQIGKIPRVALVDKIAWVKNNATRLKINWHGFGSGPLGNKANLKVWRADQSTWEYWNLAHTYNVSSLLTNSLSGYAEMNSFIDTNGFVHFLAYAEPSDGVTASIINTDYVELEITLITGATLHAPRVPLYEIPVESYNAILVTWLEAEVLARYPQVEGMQHLQNPYVMAEGENLIPPFSEWVLHANAKVLSAYDLELLATSAFHANNLNDIKVIPNQVYVFSALYSGRIVIQKKDGSTIVFKDNGATKTQTTLSFTPTEDSIKLLYDNGSPTSGVFALTNPMLTLGSTAKPFVPRNPSYALFETKLGAIGTVYDRLYSQDGKYMVRKAIEKDVVLDGSQAWLFESDLGLIGWKSFYVNGLPSTLGVGVNYAQIVTDYKGFILLNKTGGFISSGQSLFVSNRLYASISDSETGFSEHYKPSVDEVKAYFNGWKATGYTAGTAVLAEATGSLAAAATYAFLQNGPYRNVVVTKSADNVTFTPAVENTDFSIDIAPTKATLKNLTAGALYFKIDYNYGVAVNSWASIVDASAPGTQTSAFVSNAANKAPNYIPYKLSYQLATPQVTEAKFEGTISVNGLTQVEVGSGVILREKVIPQYNSIDTYNINHNSYSASLLKNKTDRILSVYKNNMAEKKAVITTIVGGNGKQWAYIKTTDYDATAEYYVAYIVYDKNQFSSNVTNLIAQYANSIRTALEDTEKKVEDVATITSVNSNLIYDILKRLKAGGL